MPRGKGLIRSLSRRGTASGKTAAAETRTGRLPEPVLCERCGAVLRNRVWRRATSLRPSHRLLERSRWATCPACVQVAREEYLGRIVVRGGTHGTDFAAIRRRMRNAASHAEFTQPERRIVSVERSGDDLEVLTTSQKLAHRIVHELKKAFGGRATYRWLDDGTLRATWQARGARG